MAKPAVNWNTVSMLTPGLKNLGNQINRWAPDRYGDSDGAVGDYAHTQEHSGHNPDDTSHYNAEWDGDKDNKSEIRAIDVDIDFNNGSNAQALVDHIVSLKPSSVLRYVIYNRHIWKATNNWQRENYDGASAHTEHIHFSGAYSDASDENTTYNYKLEEIEVALTTDDKQWIKDNIRSLFVNDPNVQKAIGNAAWNHLEQDPETGKTDYRMGGAMRMLNLRREEAVKTISDKIDELKALITPATK